MLFIRNARSSSRCTHLHASLICTKTRHKDDKRITADDRQECFAVNIASFRDRGGDVNPTRGYKQPSQYLGAKGFVFTGNSDEKGDVVSN